MILQIQNIIFNVALRGKLIGDYGSDISIYMGSNSHYVIYPINQNNEYNFVAIIKKNYHQMS